MAERDKVIKSGQITLPRMLFLAAAGGLIVSTVALGGIWLTIGYWTLSLGLALLLTLIAFDYGINPDKVTPQSAQATPGGETVAVAEGERAATVEARPRRRTTRPTKRRR